MYRCPKCKSEIPADARFCATCGFNQTNARLQATMPPQAAKGSAPARPNTIQKQAATPSTPTTPPSQPHTIPPYGQGNGPTMQRPPSFDQAASLQVQNRTAQSSTPAKQDAAFSSSGIRPVRTNTPPRPGMGSAGPSGRPDTPMTPISSGQPVPPHYGAQPPVRPASVPLQQPAPSHAIPTQQAALTPAQNTLQQQQTAADEAYAKSLSLKQRYMAEQAKTHPDPYPPREPAQDQWHAQMTQQPRDPEWARSQPSPQLQVRPQAQEYNAPLANQYATSLPHEQLRHAIPEVALTSESMVATGKAAEHWRKSWRDRQRAEAGPAVGISRGQAAVPEPLMAMQHSIARMRAVIMPQKTNRQPSRNMNFGFWVTVILLLCIATGLGSYVIWTYLPSTQLSSQISAAGNVLPTLTVKGSDTTTVAAGRTLPIHGEHFTPGNAIIFIVNNTPISDKADKQLSAQSSSRGTFDVLLPIPTTWLAGGYALQAQDNETGQHAFLNIQVLPATTAMTNTTSLDLTQNGQPIATKGLSFKTIKGKADPAAQQITLKNTGATPLQWSAATVADNNLSWLLLTNGKTGGNLATGDTDTVGVSVISAGLKSSSKAYTGRLILTVDKTQAIVPVSLIVQDTAVEVVINPNPVVAYLQAGGTCLPVTLTLINLSDQVVTWNANPFDVDKAHINLDNLTTEQGTLDPSGLPNDTKVIKISCIGAQVGEKLYHISVYYNGIAVDVTVNVRHQ